MIWLVMMEDLWGSGICRIYRLAAIGEKLYRGQGSELLLFI